MSSTMGRSTSALAALALGASGCVTGHLLDAARLREHPIEVQAAAVGEDRLWLAYTAVVTDPVGAERERRERCSAVSLETLRRDEAPVETVRVVPLADDAPLGGRPVPIVAGAEGAEESLSVVEPDDGAPLLLVLRDGGRTYAPLYGNALARSWIAPWVYPLLPLGLAVDAVGVPVLVLFAPLVIAIGD